MNEWWPVNEDSDSTDGQLVHKDVRSLHQLYQLKTVTRYNTRLRIKDESVAEHTAFVALTVLELNRQYDFDLQKALTMALLHDIAEIHTSDIPHNVKARFPEIDEASRKAELKSLEEWNQFEAVKLVTEFNEAKTVEAKIVRYADALSVILYSLSELSLGNSGFEDVLEGSSKRAMKIKGELEKWKKENTKS